MVIATKDSGLKTSNMGKVFMFMLMEQSMMEVGAVIKPMELER